MPHLKKNVKVIKSYFRKHNFPSVFSRKSETIEGKVQMYTDSTMVKTTTEPFLNVTDKENSNFSLFSESGKIILLIHSRKESVISFSAILSLAVLLIVLGICVNGVICFIMLRGKRYKRNISNFFILHLSVTELIYRLFVFPLVIYFLVPATIVDNIQCKALTFVSTVFISATFVNLVAIAKDRHENIVHPMKAWTRKYKRKIYCQLVLSVWMYATVISIPIVLSVKSLSINKTPGARSFDCQDCSGEKICDIPQTAMGRLSTAVYLFFSFLVPLIVIVTLYTKISVFLHQRSKNRVLHKVAARSKFKAVRMLAITSLGYILSLGPSAVFSLLRSYGSVNDMSFSGILTVTWVIEFETLLSSLWNPIIYAYYNGDFRKEILKLFCVGSALATKRLAISAKYPKDHL